MQAQDSSQIRQIAVTALRPSDWRSDAAQEIDAAATAGVNDILSSILAIDSAKDPLALFAAVEDMAYGAPTIAHAILPTVQAAMIIRRCASGDQAARLLPLLADKGRNAACLLLTESGGRGPSEWESTARRDGDAWVVSGRKTAVNDNGGDVFVVVAKTSDDVVQPFALESRPAGLNLRNERMPASLGLGASQLSSMELDALRLPAESQLGSDPIAAARSVALCRLLLGSVAAGAASASLDYARGWVKKRTAFGKPLAAFEGVAFDVADVDTRIQAVKLNLRQVAYDVDRMSDLEEIDEAVARTLARVTTICASAAIDGVQLMGVHGIIHEHPQELFHRVASSLSVLDIDPSRSAFELV